LHGDMGNLVGFEPQLANGDESAGRLYRATVCAGMHSCMPSCGAARGKQWWMSAGPELYLRDDLQYVL
jgi:hypothetical protein